MDTDDIQVQPNRILRMQSPEMDDVMGCSMETRRCVWQMSLMVQMIWDAEVGFALQTKS